ncbi:MAG: hypothetical protein EB084_22195, partial [Proteobacteria bacterium]|nr:hypothetical protein [Pseudomonadota bacterium]
MHPLLAAFEATPVGHALAGLASASRAFRLGGVRTSARALVLAALARRAALPLLWVTSTHDEAERLVQDATFFLDNGTPLDPSQPTPTAIVFPERAPSMFDEGTSDPERLAVLEALLARRPVVVVASVVALMQRTAAPQRVQHDLLELRVGEDVDFDGLLAGLIAR